VAMWAMVRATSLAAGQRPSTRRPLVGAGPPGPKISGDRVAGALGLHRDRDVA